MVRGKFLFVCFIEGCGLLLMLIAALIRMTLLADAPVYRMNALMNAFASISRLSRLSKSDACISHCCIWNTSRFIPCPPRVPLYDFLESHAVAAMLEPDAVNHLHGDPALVLGFDAQRLALVGR